MPSLVLWSHGLGAPCLRLCLHSARTLPRASSTSTTRSSTRPRRPPTFVPANAQSRRLPRRRDSDRRAQPRDGRLRRQHAAGHRPEYRVGRARAASAGPDADRAHQGRDSLLHTPAEVARHPDAVCQRRGRGHGVPGPRRGRSRRRHGLRGARRAGQPSGRADPRRATSRRSPSRARPRSDKSSSVRETRCSGRSTIQPILPADSFEQLDQIPEAQRDARFYVRRAGAAAGGRAPGRGARRSSTRRCRATLTTATPMRCARSSPSRSTIGADALANGREAVRAQPHVGGIADRAVVCAAGELRARGGARRARCRR